MKSRLSIVCLALLLAVPCTFAQVRSDLLVSTSWLADHQNDPNLVLIEVSHEHHDFDMGHIAGARYLAADKFVTQHGTELLPPDELKTNLEAIGIGDSSRVVVYSPMWDPMATRLIFTLDYLGFNNSALLDGGEEQWKSEKRPLVTGDPAIHKASLTVHLHPEVVATLDQVKALTAGNTNDTVILDARPDNRYKAGHLSGAQPLFWEKALASKDHPVLKTPAELQKMLADRGVKPGEKIVSYCEVGWQASYTYFLARYLGFPAAMYDGSYSEWSSAHQPVVKGDSAR